ncbi:MAG TPA: DUF1810 domain-containing protein [Microvirga sp.]|jgi:uncharacterized protein (DUF1810 family)|nr:DUF1810 domain-containing protein [Microvirga sp.]
MNPPDLDRFVDAQRSIYPAVLDELRTGHKRSHWMWFIFPQLRGLGRSPTAIAFGIASRAEAEAYLAHAVLGPRLEECTRLVLTHAGRTLNEIVGSPDDLKFRSSMTLFAVVAESHSSPFRRAIESFCGGEMDTRTLEMLGGGQNS